MASGRLSKVKGKVLDIPNPPTIGTATAGGASISIAFTADSSGKGGPTRSYIAKSNPGNITATGSTSPISVTGLTVGTSYTVSVAGVNQTGNSEYSSASNSAVPVSDTSFDSIATVTVGSGGAADVTFSSIPSTYKHLQIRGIARKNGANNDTVGVQMTFNGDTASSYNAHFLLGDGSSAVGYTTGASRANIDSLYMAGGGMTANVFGAQVIDILDYADTSKYKSTRQLSGVSSNAASAIDYILFGSGLWRSTSAITSITLTGNNFVQYSSFALYGIRGA
jgi:hypothetical protein